MNTSGNAVGVNTKLTPDGKIKILDNWLDPDLTSYLGETFLNQFPHYFVERSRKEVGKMYSHDFNPSDHMMQYMTIKIKKLFDYPINFTRIYFNVQHPGMLGMFHVDSKGMGDAGHSVMLMMTPKGEEGEFFYRPDPDDDLNVAKVDYEQNRLLIFPAEMEHYGSPFKTTPRITLVFKTLKQDYDEPGGQFFQE